MKLSAVCRTLSLTTALAIAPILQFSPNGQPSAIVSAQANRPLAIFVDGGDDCCVSQMPELEAKLDGINAEIWHTSYDRFQGSSGTEIQVRAADAPDTLFLIEGRSTLNSIPANRPIFLIGDRQGASSILKLLPLIERNIQLVALVDTPTDTSAWNASTAGSTTNVGVFLNYFQVDNPNTQNAGSQGDRCDATTRCYEFNPNTGNEADLGQWIQSDIVAKVDIAINKQLQPPSPVAVRSIPAAWTLIPGQLKHLSVGSDGDVWGVNNEDFIFRWNGNGWNNINGRLKQIAVGNAQNIWGVNAQDEVFRWDGNDWVVVPGNLKSVSVGSDGTVWGVNSEDFIFRWNGNSWDGIDGRLMQLSVGNAQGILGVNSENQVFQWNGEGWNLVSDGFKQVSFAADGTLLSLDPGDRLHRWNGSAWVPVEGNFMQVSAGNAQEIWAVNALGEIYRKN